MTNNKQVRKTLERGLIALFEPTIMYGITKFWSRLACVTVLAYARTRAI